VIFASVAGSEKGKKRIIAYTVGIDGLQAACWKKNSIYNWFAESVITKRAWLIHTKIG